MANASHVPVNDIVLAFYDQAGDWFDLRIATPHGAGVAQTIVDRLQPFLRAGTGITYSVVPSRFAPED
jgi:hypothetical protein